MMKSREINYGRFWIDIYVHFDRKLLTSQPGRGLLAQNHSIIAKDEAIMPVSYDGLVQLVTILLSTGQCCC
jgi:hypothetical protein